MITPQSYSGKNIVVLGLGKSGKTAGFALQRAGANVFVWDDTEKARLAAEAEGLPIYDPMSLDWATIDALLLSPGIPHLHPAPHPVVVLARTHDVPLISDVELLFESEKDAAYIGITGTNGKSTTTALIHHVLKSAQKPVQIGGNFGIPVMDLDPLGEQGTYVLEMSSYQLEITPSQHFQVSVFLNLTPDHLDRHGGIVGYLAAKKKIFEHSQKDDVLVLGVDDAYTDELFSSLKDSPFKVIPVSVHKSLKCGVYVDQGFLVSEIEGSAEKIVDLRELSTLKGLHNWQNAACAYAALKSRGLQDSEIVSGFKSFPGLAHRQERIAELDGILFVNDSKATNAEATSQALECYKDSTIYWLLGGRPKEGGIQNLEAYFPKIEQAFLFGESSQLFALTFEGVTPFSECGDLSTALKKAYVRAKEDKKNAPVVLLSPACASFDQFRDFEARGDAFRQWVYELIEREKAKVA